VFDLNRALTVRLMAHRHCLKIFDLESKYPANELAAQTSTVKLGAVDEIHKIHFFLPR
jgi:hypothetical protein